MTGRRGGKTSDPRRPPLHAQPSRAAAQHGRPSLAHIAIFVVVDLAAGQERMRGVDTDRQHLSIQKYPIIHLFTFLHAIAADQEKGSRSRTYTTTYSDRTSSRK